MSVETRAALERNLKDAEAALMAARTEAQGVSAQVEELAGRLSPEKIAGDRQLASLIANEDEAKRNVAVATERRDAVLRQLAEVPMAPPINGHAAVDDYGVRGAASGTRLGFNREQIEEAQAHLLGDNPRPLRLGPALGSGVSAASQSSSDWAQSQVSSYDLAHVFPWLREQPRVQDLFPVDVIDLVSRTYFRFNSPADQAAVVAENATKPQSSPHVEEFTVTPQVVAHFGQFSRQMLLNAPDFLREYTAEFVSGLNLAVDEQLVSGTGSSELHGIMTAPSVNTYVRDTTNETRADAILAGITTVRTQAFVEPTHLIIHPNDLESVRKEKATTNGLYLSNPAASLFEEGRMTSLWGLTIVATTSATQGTAIVIDPVTFGTIVLRLPIIAEIDPYSLFTTNGYQLRVETMVELACVRPKAACLVEDL